LAAVTIKIEDAIRGEPADLQRRALVSAVLRMTANQFACDSRSAAKELADTFKAVATARVQM